MVNFLRKIFGRRESNGANELPLTRSAKTSEHIDSVHMDKIDGIARPALVKKYQNVLSTNDRQQSQIQKLQETALALKGRISKQNELLEKRSESIASLTDIVAKKNEGQVSLKKVVANKDAAIERLQNTRKKNLAANDKLRDRIEKLRVRSLYFSENPAINRFLRFARQCSERADDLAADVYCAHGVQALSAAVTLREMNGGQAVCDCIEIPAFARRSIPSRWHPIMLGMVDAASEGYLRSADFLVTIGWELGKHLETLNTDVRVLPNYRKTQKLVRSNYLREKFDIPADAKVLLCMSTITAGFENVARALQKLPDDIHIVTLGHFAPKTYNEKIIKLIADLNLTDRIHIHDRVPYEDLIGVASGADLGLIVLDTDVGNNQVALPNRVFDFMAAGLPVISPNIPDIKKILTEHKFGLTLKDTSPSAWEKGITTLLKRRKSAAKNALQASEVLNWGLLTHSLLEIFNNPQRITFIGFEDLTKNNRTMRIAEWLAHTGVIVKIAGPLDETQNVADGIKLINIPKTLGAVVP